MKTETTKKLEKITKNAKNTSHPAYPAHPALFTFFQNKIPTMMRDLRIKGLIEKMGWKINYQ